ncbi:MAG: uL15 family ribosomal protein [Patescibacteria group bacterium]
MQFHNLKKNTSNRKAKQVGRGGTRGKTSGRGTKGQNARAGRKKRPEMRDIIKRLPKLRGRGKNFLKSRKVKPLAINISRVKEHFKEGEEINAKNLLAKGLIQTRSGRIPKIKVLNG